MKVTREIGDEKTKIGDWSLKKTIESKDGSISSDWKISRFQELKIVCEIRVVVRRLVSIRNAFGS